MTMTWQAETDHLICRWSEIGVRTPYNPPWLRTPSTYAHVDCAQFKLLDFRRLSPLGGLNWPPPDYAKSSWKPTTQIRAFVR
jgi:hypothetical protein